MSGLLWLSGLVILLDQLSKFWIMATFEEYEVLVIWPVFNLTLVYNTGAAFSFLSEAGGWQRWFFITLSSGVSVALIVWLWRLDKADRWLALALSLVLAGAVGNLIDRVRFGHVVDFVDMGIGDTRWYAWNISDAAVFIGIVVLFVAALLGDRAIPGRRNGPN